MRSTTKTKRNDDLTVTAGSGNVFADLGVPLPATALLKSELARRIGEVVECNGWTQVEAAEALGVDQPKVSLLLRGRLNDFSVDRLVVFLDRLGQEVQLLVKSRVAHQPVMPTTNGKKKPIQAQMHLGDRPRTGRREQVTTPTKRR